MISAKASGAAAGGLSPKQPETSAMADKEVPASPEEGRRTMIDDHSAYEAAVSEGWSVSPQWRYERGTGYPAPQTPKQGGFR
jgi:hypothetical protein